MIDRVDSCRGEMVNRLSEGPYHIDYANYSINPNGQRPHFAFLFGVVPNRAI
jgi:hypothetical protein